MEMTCEIEEEYNQRLWKNWLEKPSIYARNRLVDAYSIWCRKQAKIVFFKYPNPSLELADYVHWATLGLIDSIQRFKPDKGYRFEAFAVFRVKGEILNNLSKISDQSAYASARNKILSERVGSLLETGKESNCFEGTIEFIRLFALGTSLDELSLYAGSSDENYFAGDYLLSKHLSRSIKELSERERIVINYHYISQLSFVEISELLEVSKGRISQIHSAALKKLSTVISGGELF